MLSHHLSRRCSSSGLERLSRGPTVFSLTASSSISVSPNPGRPELIEPELTFYRLEYLAGGSLVDQGYRRSHVRTYYHILLVLLFSFSYTSRPAWTALGNACR